ncbi:ead/Ea22-like family protein, partial [Klebsiella pneumoniae]|uniref:ead/Ea22-like family protein n=1 Tax=Klebsiella pneumoniae TaxID=573 RepID=UPI00201FF34D
MTDITELAQSLKAAAENAIGAHERLAAYPYGEIIDISQHEGEQIDIDITDLNEFNKEANPVNILALVESLEKAQAENTAGVAGMAESYETTISMLRSRIAELESRTVKLPAELYTIGELIRTQDNRITDQPMFVVFQKREIIGSDEHSPSRICWVWDGEEVSELRAKRLEALYQDGRDTRGYDRYAMQEVDEFVTACFTEHGCKDYLRQNGHNLRLPYIYACGSFRNNEYQLVRNWL